MTHVIFNPAQRGVILSSVFYSKEPRLRKVEEPVWVTQGVNRRARKWSPGTVAPEYWLLTSAMLSSHIYNIVQDQKLEPWMPGEGIFIQPLNNWSYLQECIIYFESTSLQPCVRVRQRWLIHFADEEIEWTVRYVVIPSI